MLERELLLEIRLIQMDQIANIAEISSTIFPHFV